MKQENAHGASRHCITGSIHEKYKRAFHIPEIAVRNSPFSPAFSNKLKNWRVGRVTEFMVNRRSRIGKNRDKNNCRQQQENHPETYTSEWNLVFACHFFPKFFSA
ncbi:MAG: hypothetical protein IKI18_05270 [Prevotella sp.]|nr:hypothetical protein [Prevotella sp.]